MPRHPQPHCRLNKLLAVLVTVLGSPMIFAQETGTSDISDTSKAPWTASAELVEEQSSRQPNFNYREASVPAFQLPDPLVFNDDSKVTEGSQWPKRRDELLEHFRQTVYGVRPEKDYTVQYIVLETIPNAFDGLATGTAIEVQITANEKTYRFPFVLFVPNQTVSKVPAIVHINNRYFVPLDKAVNETDPFWPVATMLENGFATASFHTSDVDPDRKDGYEEGVRAFIANGQSPADNAWRSLSAWGWGASLVLDYLEQLPVVDAKKVAVSGHSRGGKTALWAACEDERFAIAYSNNSGCGGAALSRRSYGETVGRITSVFPHWFSPNFAKYSDRVSELPIDQHEVFALLAPRAAYVASADEDLWADPKGEYASLVSAHSVYKLLGEDSINQAEMPRLNSQRTQGKTGYHIRPGGHGLGLQDWEWFLSFAKETLK